MIGRLLPSMRVPARASGLALLTLVQLGAVEAHQRMAAPERRAAIFDQHMRVWARALLRLFGVRIKLHPTKLPQRRAKARLVVANHRTPFDIGIVLSIFGGQVLSRDDLSKWPILGTAARKAGTIFVDRDQSASGAQAIRQIRRSLREGATVTVFPEGTTFGGDEVRPFRVGAFVSAQRLDVEVVPVGIAYEHGAEFLNETFVEHLKRSARRRRTCVSVCVGEPFKAEGRAAELGSRIHEKVQALVNEARNRM